MGGKGSGRKSVKLMAIENVMEVQCGLQQLYHEDLDGNMTRDQIKEKVAMLIQKTKVTQEEIERA